MNRADYSVLLHIAELKFAAECNKMADVARRETAVRLRIHETSKTEKLAEDQFQSNLQLRAAPGMEVSWRRWIGHQKAAANSDLAKVMVEKLKMMEKVQNAFGKREVLLELQNKAASQKHSQK
jgi:hypothetical protein